MIEKLDKNLAGNINSCNMSQNIMVAHKAIEKINELVDAVNGLKRHEEQHLELLTQLNEMRLQNTKKIKTDPYEEQRKWEGKLCWFWDEYPEDKIVDVLSCIDISDKYPYVMCDRQVHYKHCEPVKPDDDIIFKGE